MMRITVVLAGFSHVPVGGFLILYEYANRLARRGHHVRIFHAFLDAAEMRAAGVSGIRGRPPAGFWFPVDERVDFSVQFARTHEDLPEADIAINAGLTPAAKGAPVNILQGFAFAEGADDYAALSLDQGKVATTRWIYDLALERGVAQRDLAYVPNAIDHECFRLTRALEARPARIAMLCHPLPIKGAEDGIAALTRVREARPGTEAVLFGAGPRPSYAPGWVDYRQLPSRDELVEDVYNGSSLYLCPSRKDSFHLPAAEAMACGCALVSTDLDVTEYAEHEVTALLSPPGRPELLAANLLSLLENEPRRLMLARQGQERTRGLSWNSSIDALEQFLLARCRTVE